jgi:hypothetical protein
VREWRVEELVRGLQAYVDGDDPVYTTWDPRFLALHEFLRRTCPDPRGFGPLLGPHAEREDVDERLLKRDKVANAVVTSFLRRIVEEPDDPHRAALFDAVSGAGVHFSFDRAYGDSHTITGVEIADFFSTEEFPVTAESRAALEKHLEASIEAWRRRVTDKATSNFFGIHIRHLGAAAVDRFLGEWEGMHPDERYDLLRRAERVEGLSAASRSRVVEALLDPGLDVREAAAGVLRAQGAPLGDLDASAPEGRIRAALPALRAWAAGG